MGTLSRRWIAFLIMTALCPLSTDAAATETATDRFRISVITMGRGIDLFSRFGHIGLLVEDKKTSTEKLYNFGSYNFSNPALRFQYLKGHLTFWVSVHHFPSAARRYRNEDRQLEQRVLRLDGEKAARIAAELEIIARPENRQYAYRHFLNNCCTRIRDIVDEASGGAIASLTKGQTMGRTYRDLTRMSVKGSYWGAAGGDFILGPAGDKPIDLWEEQFLPAVLADVLDRAADKEGRPLVASKIVLHQRQGPPLESVSESWDAPLMAILLLLCSTGFVMPVLLGRDRPQIGARLAGIGLLTWAVLGGMGGAILAFLWTLTTHYDFHRNENLLCFLPTHLLLLIPSLGLIIRGRLRRTMGRITALYLALSVAILIAGLTLKLRAYPQENYGFMAFCLAMNIACLAALWRTGIADVPFIRRVVPATKGRQSAGTGPDRQ